MYRNYMQKRACCCNNICDNNSEIMEDNCECMQYTMNNMDMCECGFDEENVFPSNPMLAQSYVPWQTMERTFIPNMGLRKGTIFPELVSPYMPGQSMAEINFIKNYDRKECN